MKIWYILIGMVLFNVVLFLALYYAMKYSTNSGAITVQTTERDFKQMTVKLTVPTYSGTTTTNPKITGYYTKSRFKSNSH